MSGADDVVRIGSGDVALHVEVRGDGPPVVLHPSLGRWARDFDPIVPALHDGGFRTIAIDPRGIATSSGPLDAVTLRTCADDVVAVLDALGLETVHLVGHAFGNRVMRQLASAHPGRTRSIALLGAGGRVHGDPEARAAIGRCFDLSRPDAERLEAIHIAFFAPDNDPRVWLDGWFPEAMLAQQRAVIGAEPEQWWSGGTGPMLVVQALQDRAAPPANGRTLVEERQAPTQLAEIDGAGHALIPEQPAAVVARLVPFLHAVEASR